MLFQVKVPTKALAAGSARKWLSLVVRVHVKGEVIDLMERLTTFFTFKPLFVAMSEFVVLVISFLVEAFSTEFTDIWFVSLMYSAVSI